MGEAEGKSVDERRGEQRSGRESREERIMGVEEEGGMERREGRMVEKREVYKQEGKKGCQRNLKKQLVQ